MGRRAKGEGSISRRTDGSYMGQRWVITPEGERKRATVYGKTKRDVSDQLAALAQQERDAGQVAEPGKITVGEYLKSWLNDVAKHSVRPTTWATYEACLRNHTKAISAIRLAQLTGRHLQRLYSERIESGLSRRTVQHLHVVLHSALKHAVHPSGLLPRNPADHVTKPKPERHEAQVWTQHHIQAFMAAIQGDMYEALFILAISTGMRRGELVGLRWRDVDLDRGVIRVTQTAQRGKGGVRMAEPKTDRSRRLITLPGYAVDVLINHRDHQADQQAYVKAKVLPLFREHGLVFARGSGEPVSISNVSHHFRRVVNKLGLPPIRFHDLRHTHATLLLAAGTHPKVVSERLGHSSVTMTLDTYSHVVPVLQEQVAEVMDAVLTSKTPVTPIRRQSR